MKRDRYGKIVFLEDTLEYLVWPSALKEQLEEEKTLLFETWPEQLGLNKTPEEWKKENKGKTREEMRRLFKSQMHLLELQMLYDDKKLLRHMERHNDFLKSVLAPPKSENSPSVETKVKYYIKAMAGVWSKEEKKKKAAKKTKEHVYATTDEWLNSGKKKK